jgi:ABC-type Mn2+/Zn2+ transport system permease subunit
VAGFAIVATPIGSVASSLLRPFDYEFFRKGLFVATLAGALLGLVGVFVVLRSMSYIGHGLSHAIFGGYAVSGLIGVNVLLGAGVWGFLSAALIGRVARRTAIGTDAVIGVVTTASFALGIVLLEAGGGSPAQNFDAALFGSVYGVSGQQIVGLLVVSAAVVVAVYRWYRTLLFVTFDPVVASASGVRVPWFDAGMMAALAASVLVTMNVLGVTRQAWLGC